MNKKYISQSSNINQKNQNIALSSKSENESVFDFFTTIKDKIVGLFESNDIIENKSSEHRYNLGDQCCNCKKTISKEYCDSIYEILQMTKNTENKRSKELYENLLKIHEKSLDINGDNLRQIKKDLNRTYPSSTTFKKDRILNKLKNVLRAFSNYDNSIKYFQGMNFIVGFFLYHCDEYIAFWLFVSLIEEYDLRSLFMDQFPGLKLHVKRAFWLFVSLIEEYDLRSLFMDQFPGLKLHVKRVELILKNEYPFNWEMFQKIGVKVEIFMVEWLFSLFSSLIPLDLQIDFYKGFFSHGWIFFYKMCISTILNLKGHFSEADEIYIGLKCGKNADNLKEEEIRNKWKTIIQKAYTIEIKTDVMNINQ